MNKTTIKLDDIQAELFPVLTTTNYGNIWLNGIQVEYIHIYKNTQYRLTTRKGEYRYPVGSDISIEIMTY